MMTPDFLKPSSSFSYDLGDQIDHQDHNHHHLILFQGSSSLVSPSPNFLNSNSSQDQSTGVAQTYEQRDQKDVVDLVNSNTSQKMSAKYEEESTKEESNNNTMKNNGGSVKYWMSSKMRLIHKMSNPEMPAKTQKPLHKTEDKTQITFSFSHTSNNNNGTIRVCSDCNTTSTPLWRSGPRGPKSLCNACGIRQRKARRAMAEAAAAAAGDNNNNNNNNNNISSNNNSSLKTSYTYNKTHIAVKEKKARGNNHNNNIAHYKSKLKLRIVDTASTSSKNIQKHTNNNNKLCFGDFTFGLNDKTYHRSALSGMFPQDVAEAALLLMEMSCHGLVQS